MATGLWTNVALGSMPEGQIIQVCDSIGGTVYTVRWHGQRFGWEIITFPQGFTPAARPVYWLSYATNVWFV